VSPTFITRRLFLGAATASIAAVAVPQLQAQTANAAIAEPAAAAEAVPSSYAGIVGVL
jgi:hypothetical protein